MSNNMQNWEDDDFEQDEQVETSNLANDLVKQLRKADRAKERRLKELEAELNSYRSERRNQTISSILETEGVNPRIAKYIPADVTDKDAVKAWLEENAEDFGITRNQQQEEPAVDEAAYRRMNDATAGALNLAQIDDIYAQIDRAETPEEVAALLAQLG